MFDFSFRHRRLRFMALVLPGVLMLSVWGADAPTPATALPLDSSGVLQLPAALRLLLERSFALQVREIDVLMSHDDVTRVRGAFDPKFFASTTLEDNKRKLNAINFSSYGLDAADPQTALYNEKNLRAATGISGKTPFTGTQYELSATLDRLENDVNRAGRYYFPEYETFAGLTLTQPLLKGLLYGGPNAEVNSAKFAVRIADRTREIEVVNKMVELLNAYYDMVFGLENARVKSDAVAIALKLRDENEKRRSVGKMTSLDVTQAEVKVSEAREEVVLAEDFLRERRVRLLKLLLRSFEAGPIPAFTAAADLSVVRPTAEAGALTAAALEQRPDYLLSRDQIKRDALTARASLGDRLPQLDVRFSYGRGGLESEASRSFRQVYDDNHRRVSGGVVLQMPIGNRTAAATARNSKRRQQQAELRSEELRTTIAIEVSNALGRLEALQRRLENATQSRTLAAAGLEVEMNRLDAGKTTSFNVLDLQQKTSEARTREVAARVDLKKAEAELWAATGELPARLGLAINPVVAAAKSGSVRSAGVR
jgi:outer membrane protein